MIARSLPTYPVPFIGRGEELKQIAALLSDPTCHLLTLVGPGGIGKTRLALEVARSMTLADGICFVDLQPVNASQVLITAIANALNILLSSPEDPRAQILSYLSTNKMLLLLDNFEQLLDGIDLLSDILRIAPDVKLLVTSREALNLQEEWLWHVGGLQVPDHDTIINIESYSAVQLFAECARRTRHTFQLSGQEKPVTRICQLVEGLPLALELAAGWTNVLSCAEIADEIQRELHFLTTNKRNALERHQSMQVVFDHSWRLLTQDERAVFARLSVFRGGFRREAAERVANASLVVLAGLVDKSFLWLSAAGRYEIHELTRQYGEERLETVPGEKQEAHFRHCAYYAGFLHQHQLTLRGPQQATALDEIGEELDNARVCWEWAVEHDLSHEIHQSMHSLYVFCHIRMQAAEGERLFDLAIKRFEQEDSAILAYLSLARIQLYWFNGKSIDHNQFLRAIRLARTFWIEDQIALPLRAYFWVRNDPKVKAHFDDRQYEQVCRDFLEIFRTHAQPWGAAYMLFCLGDISRWHGQLEEADSYFRQSMNDFLLMGDRWGSCWSSMGLAWVTEASEHYHEALYLWEQHQEVCAEVGDRGGVVYALANEARITGKLQDTHAAKFYICQAINAHLGSGSQFAHLDEVLRSLIAVFVSENKYERAAELSSFLRQQANSASAQDVREAAHQALASLARKLPPEVYRQALERGKTLHLRLILEQLFDEVAGYTPPAYSTLTGREHETAANQRQANRSLEEPPAEHRLELLREHRAGENNPSTQIKPSLADPLTPRELEILQHMSAGLTNREIAEHLVIGVGTVKKHISHIYGKLGTSDRIKAILQARALDLLPSSTP
jgi:predicted ATPase/DNA-binding NarL/FixJ family response regulator